jgi:hypothetical protein
MNVRARNGGSAVRRIFIISMLTGMVALSVGGTAVAGKPTIERITVNDTFQDAELNEHCGVDATITVVGKIIVRTFDSSGTGPVEVRTLNQAVTLTAGNNTYRFRDVGADIVLMEPDGSATLMIIGQIPFEFNGALKIDLQTGEVIHEPQFKFDPLATACAVLTA